MVGGGGGGGGSRSKKVEFEADPRIPLLARSPSLRSACQVSTSHVIFAISWRGNRRMGGNSLPPSFLGRAGMHGRQDVVWVKYCALPHPLPPRGSVAPQALHDLLDLNLFT